MVGVAGPPWKPPCTTPSGPSPAQYARTGAPPVERPSTSSIGCVILPPVARAEARGGRLPGGVPIGGGARGQMVKTAPRTVPRMTAVSISPTHVEIAHRLTDSLASSKLPGDARNPWIPGQTVHPLGEALRENPRIGETPARSARTLSANPGRSFARPSVTISSTNVLRDSAGK